MTPWTVASQATLPVGFFRQGHWNGFPCPSSGDLPHPGIEPPSPELPGGFFTDEPAELNYIYMYMYIDKYRYVCKYLTPFF